jgi:hypothetical protein
MQKHKKKGNPSSPTKSPGPRMFGAGDIIVKRFTNGSVISTNASGFIALTTTWKASLVQSQPASEWASFAARYQQYRVRQLKVIGDPAVVVNFYNGSAVESIGQIWLGGFIGASAPTSAVQVLSDERSLVQSASKRFVFTVTWKDNPNAKLWNPTSAAVPTANDYGIAIASNTNVSMLASQEVYSLTFLWDVELRGSQ